MTKLKKMLMVLSERVPQTPNMNDLYRELETNREQGLRMLQLLQQAELIALLNSPTKSLKRLSKPAKIYLDNANLMYALTPLANKGTLRETFFFNQMRTLGAVTLPAKGDFLIDGHLLFEVGGRNKTFEQIKDEPDSYLAVDGIEYGLHNRIPLYAFGLMY
ncbi:MAG: hypothetical protein IJR13_08480 [Bacteroidales bacterium]|nr:hypothetical protein [Bacteroidales bacterium]